jgi:nucleolar protein 9
MVCVGSKAIRPKGSTINDLGDGALDDSSHKKRTRKDKSEKHGKGGHSSSKGPSVGKPRHVKDRKQRKDDGKKGKGRRKDHHSGSSVMVNPRTKNLNNQDAVPSSDTSKPVQNVLRYEYGSSCLLNSAIAFKCRDDVILF